MNRSGFFHNIAAGAIGVTVLHNQALAALIEPDLISEHLYIGSYPATIKEGISICRFDPDNGTIQLVDVLEGVINPSFLIFDNQRKYVYAVNETGDFGGKSSGSVSAFRRDEKTGMLTLLNMQPSLGAHPCHLTIDRTGKYILVANYSGGNVAVLPILTNGQLGEPVDMVQHTGKGVNSSRQEAAHAHSVNLSPDNRFAFVCDLGIDKIMIYRFDRQTGKLAPADTPYFQSAPGAGPRHFTFSKDGGHAFVVNELNSTVTSFRYDSAKGILTEVQTLSTIPDGFTGENTCADVHGHPNGRFVYASNRGNDSIAVFSTERESGKLVKLQHQSTLGKTPRNFTIHSSGRFLLAANQNSDSVNVFSIDAETGKLSFTGKSIQIPKPVCLLF
ncbi:MAG: lactonase family protein [Bacteroidia bacterium]|nr:lactonase family protein [Bacteroidia bacterium]